jgi:hypothetical protein
VLVSLTCLATLIKLGLPRLEFGPKIIYVNEVCLEDQSILIRYIVVYIVRSRIKATEFFYIVV